MVRTPMKKKSFFFLMSIISGNPELVLFVYFDLRLLQKTRRFLRCKTKTNRDMFKYSPFHALQRVCFFFYLEFSVASYHVFFALIRNDHAMV